MNYVTLGAAFGELTCQRLPGLREWYACSDGQFHFLPELPATAPRWTEILVALIALRMEITAGQWDQLAILNPDFNHLDRRQLHAIMW